MKKDETLITFTHKGRSVTVTASTLAKAARVARKRRSAKSPS
jgi:hypothetical protein